MRKLLIGIGVLIVLLVAAALIAPSLIDWNGYKADIAARVKAATGRDLDIRGPLDLSLLPSPHLSARDVRLANIPGASPHDMARLESLDVAVRFMPLLAGRIEVESVTLVRPTIVLERLADGRVNWNFAPPGPGGGATARRGGQTAAPVTPAVRFDHLRIQDGTLIWRDASAKEERLDRIDADIGAGSLAGPFSVKATLAFRGTAVDVTGAVGRIDGRAGPAPLSLVLALPDGAAKADLGGTLTNLPDAPHFSGKIDMTGRNLAGLMARAGAGGTGPLPPYLAKPFTLSARLAGAAERGAVDDLDIQFGDAHLSGQASLAIDDRVRADVKLRLAALDLDRWLAAKPAAGPALPGSSNVPSSAAEPSTATTPAGFSLPAGIDASFDLTAVALSYGGEAVQDLHVNGRLGNGGLTFNRVSLRLPGGGDATFAGFLSADRGRPNFDGTAEVHADNLRSILRWMKVDIGDVPADRLRKFALSAKLHADDRQFQVLGAKVSLDTSRIDGGVTFARRDRLAFGASVNIDQLNLDAYLPPPDMAKGATAKAPPGPGAAKGAAPASAHRGPLAVLQDFDANLRFRIGSLTWRRTTARDIRFDGTLAQGRLAIHDASVASLAGTKASVEGTLSGFGALPVFDGSFSADSKDASGVLRMAGLEPPPAIASLGAMHLRGKADGGADKVRLDSTLDVAGGRLSLAGTLDGLRTAPKYDLTLGVRHNDFAKLAAAFGAEDAIPSRAIGPVALTVALKGDLAAVHTVGKLTALGGEASLAGDVSGLPLAPKYDLVLKASDPDFNALLRGLAPDYRPQDAKVGPFGLDAHLTGGPEAATFSNVKARIGKIALSGEGKVTLGGARPKLVVSLTGGEIDLDPLLPAAQKDPSDDPAPTQGGVPAVGPGGNASAVPDASHFPAEPFDLSALGDLDADLSLGADSLVYRKVRIGKPVVKATLADSLLTIRQAAGRLFGGDVLLKGKLNGKAGPAFDGSVRLTGADAGKALFQVAAFDVAGGKLDFDMSLAGSGASPQAMVASLDGRGKLSVKNGAVKGFDLKAVSDRLKSLDRGVDFLQLFGTAMGGGETPFSSIAGTFKVTDGVLRTDDLKLVADAGEGQAHGSADLPRWLMDFTAEFRLTDHPEAPPFSVTAKGPIDDPQRIFHVEKLQDFLVQRGIGTLLKKALPEPPTPPRPKPPVQAAPESRAQPSSPSPPRRQSPEEILRGLLNGLRR